MTGSELVLEFVKVLAWPVTAIILLLVYRKAIIALLPKSKITVKIFGIEFDINPQELKMATSTLVDGGLDKKQMELLKKLGPGKVYSFENEGISSDDWKWIRPLMFAGLIRSNPAGTYQARNIKGLVATALGELLIDAINSRGNL